MFAKLSMVGVGAVVVIIEALARVLGLELPEGSALSAVNAVIEVVGFILLVIGQLRRPDLLGGIVRR